MPVSDALARGVVDAGGRRSLTASVLEEWARRGTPRQVECLAGHLEAGRDSRDASRRARLLRRCGLPAPKVFDGYDWSAASWPDGLGREELLPLSFLERREDLVLMGDVGTGKTHMASALCQLACDRRLEARFFTASSLVMRLRRARDEGGIDREGSVGKVGVRASSRGGPRPGITSPSYAASSMSASARLASIARSATSRSSAALSGDGAAGLGAAPGA